MKNSIFTENVKQVKTVGELKLILDKYSDETELVAETSNAITDLFVGITYPVGDRETEEETLLIFGGNEK
jgi:hypothetical protein